MPCTDLYLHPSSGCGHKDFAAILENDRQNFQSSRTEEHLKTKLKNIQKKNRRQERKEQQQQQAQQGGIARALAKDLEGMHISSGGEVVDLS